ncbi:ATPase, T2SS/T4P/T4SS family [Defluviicoccus vanus]|uniref:Flp pilus assembly complex ATPase component TadA n=1 Tax=Defluviicoccus vanus TaxID=111831 RepID=A0A7H1N6X4_9PROT|nr:ATPase, T2SS/T4P/T4SS family [Defluviicoccus vanus]QNT71460.1 Flp pilus assembly complex ATPase component TadA [Defluviicoccus vanus]
MSIVELRLEDGLRHALGADVARLLDEPAVTDLLLNADGRLWVDRTGRGREDTGCTMTAADADAALRLIAHHCGVPLTRTAPVLSATLPRTGERIAATIAPITTRPTFAIRKPPAATFELTAFAPKAAATGTSANRCRHAAESGMFEALRAAVEAHRNILIAGSTGSGKTSLLSALLALPSVQRDRCLVLEDTQEIRIEAPDHVRMLTSADVGMRGLVQLSLRYRPDRIVLGEVRSGDAAMELIHAMNTGHSGSFCTVHANSAPDALGRVEDLCAEVCPQPPCRSIATAIGCIVFVQRTAGGREITEVVLVDGWQNGKYVTTAKGERLGALRICE